MSKSNKDNESKEKSANLREELSDAQDEFQKNIRKSYH